MAGTLPGADEAFSVDANCHHGEATVAETDGVAKGAVIGAAAGGGAYAAGFTAAGVFGETMGAVLAYAGGTAVAASAASAAGVVGVVAGANALSKANAGIWYDTVTHPFAIFGPSGMEIEKIDFAENASEACTDTKISGAKAEELPRDKILLQKTKVAKGCTTEYHCSLLCTNHMVGSEKGYNCPHKFRNWHNKLNAEPRGRRALPYICARQSDVFYNLHDKSTYTGGSATAKAWAKMVVKHVNEDEQGHKDAKKYTYVFYVMMHAEGIDTHTWYLGAPKGTRSGEKSHDVDLHLQIESEESGGDYLHVHAADTYADSTTGLFTSSTDTFAFYFVKDAEK